MLVDTSTADLWEIIGFNNKLNMLVNTGKVPYHDYVRFDMQTYYFDPSKPSDTPKYKNFKLKLDALRNMEFDSYDDMDQMQDDLKQEMLTAKTKRRNSELN
jgi:hypothetical protein